MLKIKACVSAVAMAMLSTGCSVMAPQYTASMDNVHTLRDGGDQPARVGSFGLKEGRGDANTVSLRGNSMTSPYNGSYAEYLSAALKQELLLAKRLSPTADTEISGELIKNEVDASGLSVGTTQVQARFVVQRGNQIRYDQVKSVRHEFPSAFAGAVAIPRAVQEYTVAVQKLLAELYADNSFITALKP